MEIHPIAIIGAGPAGIAAAIQLKRYGFAPLVFERERIGGLLCNANLVENYPGFPKGIRGIRLVQHMVAHLENLHIPVKQDEVLEADWQPPLFRLHTTGGSYQARILVVASGTQPVTFSDFSVPVELTNRVYYEVYPLMNVHGAQIAIVGAGDAAFDYALNLSRWNKVLILNRGEQASCLPLLEKRARTRPRIRIFKLWRVIRIVPAAPGSENDRFTLECATPEGITTLEVDYLLGAIGRLPCFGFLSEGLLIQKNTLVEQGLLHIIGDVHAGHYRQTAIAAGEGIEAAMKIAGLLKEEQK